MAVTSPLAHIMKKQKLELTEIGKEHRPKLEPRILIEDPTQSHHANQRATDNGPFDNRLLFGDNRLALKALAAFRGSRRDALQEVCRRFLRRPRGARFFGVLEGFSKVGQAERWREVVRVCWAASVG